jgi:quinol-cytochrome oxidoreductase complex cytochrome b subunit
MSYPHLILREAIAFQVLTIVLVAVALFWDAPLEQLANPLLTPNPAKAPWYFLGLQELLHYFPPIVAGVLIPTLVVLGLVVIPYFEINVQGEPLWSGNRRRRVRVLVGVLIVLGVLFAVYDAWTVLVPTVVVGVLALLPYVAPSSSARFVQFLKSRTVSWWVMTWFIAVALTLTLVGTFFRGPGWSWVWPWSRHAS